MSLTIMTFPYEQIGWGLRQMSLSGAIGNMIAIIIYVSICLIPCVLYVILVKKKKAYTIDLCLIVISMLLFGVVYFMINPNLLHSNIGGMEKVLICSAFNSVLLCYVIVRIVKACTSTEMEVLKKGIRALLLGVMLMWGTLVCVELFVNLPTSIQTLKDKNSTALMGLDYGTADLDFTIMFLYFQSVVSAIPYLLNILVVYRSIKLLDELLRDSYSDKAVVLSEKLAKLCERVLVITVILGTVFNLLQFICQNKLYQINMTVSIPLFSILFVLVVFLLTRYIRENQKLKQDNELFI